MKKKVKEPDFVVYGHWDDCDYRVFLKAKEMHAINRDNGNTNHIFKIKEKEISGEYVVEFKDTSGLWWLLFDEDDYNDCPFARAFINNRIDKILLNE